MKMLLHAVLCAVALLPMAPTALTADAWECEAQTTGECTATLILADGTQVPITLGRGEELHRGEGITVVLTSTNWGAI